MKKIALLLLLPYTIHAQIITTFAGNGTATFTGDGGPAIAAGVSTPRGVSVGGDGSVYIACWGSRVYKVNTVGIINTFAGNGTTGYMGDGGPATAAQLNNPTNIAFDHFENIYIADPYNHRIRKVNSSGIITTFAGTGTIGTGGDGGPATSAELNYPAGIAFDNIGNAYIADQLNNNVRKVNPAGIISTFAGTGVMGYSGDGGAATAAQLNYPIRVLADGPEGENVYITDYGNNRIRVVNSLGIISLFAGNGTATYYGDGGAATAASLSSPHALAIDGCNNLYIGDVFNQRIRKVTPAGTITTIAGTGIAGYSGDGGDPTLAELNQPRGIALDNAGNMYVACYADNRVRKISSIACELSTNDLQNHVESITLYPNPINSKLNIISTNKIGSVIISNIIGQTVFKDEYPVEKVQIDITDLPSGIYFVKIKGTDVRKIVKM